MVHTLSELVRIQDRMVGAFCIHDLTLPTASMESFSFPVEHDDTMSAYSTL